MPEKPPRLVCVGKKLHLLDPTTDAVRQIFEKASQACVRALVTADGYQHPGGNGQQGADLFDVCCLIFGKKSLCESIHEPIGCALIEFKSDAVVAMLRVKSGEFLARHRDHRDHCSPRVRPAGLNFRQCDGGAHAGSGSERADSSTASGSYSMDMRARKLNILAWPGGPGT